MNSPAIYDRTGIAIPGILALSMAAYTQPAVGANVTVSVDDTTAFLPGFCVSGTGGSYDVVSVDVTGRTVVLKNNGAFGNLAPATLFAAGARFSPYTRAGVAGLPPTQGIMSSDRTLALGLDTVVFVGVTNGPTARAWAVHGGTNGSAKIGVLQCVCTDLGAGSVQVDTSALNIATGAVEAGDLSDVVVYLLDAP